MLYFNGIERSVCRSVLGSVAIAVVAVLMPSPSASASISQVIVPSVAPAATGISTKGTPFTVLEGNKYIGSVASFTANASAKASDFYAIITWGDGTKSTGVIVKDGAGAFHVVGVHSYAEEHHYITSVKITQSKVGSVVATSVATVPDAPLVPVSGRKASVFLGQTFSGRIGTFVDTDPLNTQGGDYKGTVNWGDGTSSTVTFVRTGIGKWTILGSHKYKATGSYNLTITLRDTGGAPPIMEFGTINVK